MRTCLSAVRERPPRGSDLGPATRCDPSFVVDYAFRELPCGNVTEVSCAGSSTHEHSAEPAIELSEYEVNRAPASFNLHYFLKVMDPLACFFVLVLGGEVYETAKLLRGHWFGLRGPIRLFGFLSL